MWVYMHMVPHAAALKSDTSDVKMQKKQEEWEEVLK